MASDSFQPLTSRSLFVVGDDAQSIYGFRGSKVEIILNFAQNYSKTKRIILDQNYRSVSSVLKLAEQILTHNPKQVKKGLFTQNTDQTEVSYYLAANERIEAEYIVKQLYDLYLKKSGNLGQNKTETEKTRETEKKVGGLDKKVAAKKYTILLKILDKLDANNLKNKFKTS